jgi:protein involved in polysaccharide export with SLBB domain
LTGVYGAEYISTAVNVHPGHAPAAVIAVQIGICPPDLSGVRAAGAKECRMGRLRTFIAAVAGSVSAGFILAAHLGCALLPPNSFLDPTKVGRFSSKESEIRRLLTARDTPPGLPNATDPTPEDLVPVFDDYRVGAGDAVQVTIQDLLTPGGPPWAAVLEVSSAGEIRIPEVGTIRVVGLTEGELEREITSRLKEASILVRPIVQAFVQVKRGRTFSIMGAVAASGPYPITGPDMRLLEAVGMAGDVQATARRLYVIRRTPPRPGTATTQPPAEALPKEKLVIPPPAEENGYTPGGLVTAGGTAQQETAPTTASQAPTREELGAILAPSAQTQPATRETAPAVQPPFEPLIFDPLTGKVIEAQRPTTQAEPVVRPAPVRKEELEQPFDWENVADFESGQRVIGIEVGELKGGNPRYNVVIRERDVISVPIDTGVFYAMGEISRPGVYAFGGRDITIKQAIATAGGFSPMAWPQRCEVIRRETGTDKQIMIPVNLDAIYAGLEPDFYLKDDDIINVGSHIVAPFLYVVRNSFRFTYGFGFVYDRNFADRDAYNVQANPADVRRAQRQARGLPF